jgi:hypothetical protein
MKLPARIVVWMLPLTLAGCFHRSHPAPQKPLAPPLENSSATTPVPEPTTPVVQPSVETAPEKTSAQEATQAPAQKSEAPRPPARHKKAPNKNPQIAANGTPGVSAIGQLSSGTPGDYRRQTEDSIAAAERTLRGINRPLSDQDQRTLAHIREFLKQAHHALASGDVDGAHTLAAKARVLLNELNR